MGSIKQPSSVHFQVTVKMKLFSICAIIAPVLSEELFVNNNVNKKDSWNAIMANLDAKTIKKECAAFKQGRGFVPETPWICDPKKKKEMEKNNVFKGTAFDGQMMLLSATDRYGCWCDIANGLQTGGGDPVNELDLACRTLFRDYQCMEWDAKQEGETCFPRELDASIGDYNLPVSALSPLTTPQVACALYNIVDSCAYNTCVVEAHFLRKTVSPVYAADLYWIDMWNDVILAHEPEGPFDPATDGTGQCTKKANPPPVEGRACCTPHPGRRFYNKDDFQCINENIVRK